MLLIKNGTLKVQGGTDSTKLYAKDLLIEENGVLENDGKVYTETTVSYGTINGSGELWAWWKTSEFIGGVIDAAQTVVYYGDRPVDRRWIQIMSGSIIVSAVQNYWSLKD